MPSQSIIYSEIFTGEYFVLAVNQPDYSPVNNCLVCGVHITQWWVRLPMTSNLIVYRGYSPVNIQTGRSLESG
jgi:hypothetical protein